MASIEKRGENSYRITVCDGYKSNGTKNKKRKSVTLDPGLTPKQIEKELHRQATLFEEEVKRGTYLDAGKMTFKEFIERWLRDHAEKQLETKTLYRYKEIINTRIIPALGHIKLNKLQPNHLLEFYNNLQEDGIRKDGKPGGLSEKTIKQHHAIIHCTLEHAVLWQLITSNPADRVKPPKVPKKEAKHLTEDEASLLLEVLNTAPLKYQALIYLDLVTGMRRGELIALKWNNINFDEGTLEVNQAVGYTPESGQFLKDPKNETSKRIIALPPSVIALLKKHKATQNKTKLKLGDAWQDENWLFTKWNGELIHVDTVSSWFPEFIRKYNLSIKNNIEIPHNEKDKYLIREVNFHALRHTAATLLINQGLNVKAVSTRLGHSNTSTTLNIYAHSLRSADKKAADMMEEIFTKKSTSTATKKA